jgi:hypothetical protein
MGLSCRAYKNARYVGYGHVEWDSEGKKQALDDDDNPMMFEGAPLTENFVELPDSLLVFRGSLEPGIYVFDEMYDWPAGSYSSYHEFREGLAKLRRVKLPDGVDAPLPAGEPFESLLYFCQEDSVLDASTCAKLWADFVTMHPRAVVYAKKLETKKKGEGEYWFNKYESWMTGLEVATNSGFVFFR